MTWPWRKHARDQKKARERVVLAEAEAIRSKRRRFIAERQAAHAMSVHERLQKVVGDGWTEGLREAWGGK